jgi:hypothetical protein
MCTLAWASTAAAAAAVAQLPLPHILQPWPLAVAVPASLPLSSQPPRAAGNHNDRRAWLRPHAARAPARPHARTHTCAGKRALGLCTDARGWQGGTLDKEEVAEMAKILAKKFPKIEFIPPFDLEKDFEKMDIDNEGEVTYDQFERWWRDRTGDDDPDIPVLPESMVRARQLDHALAAFLSLRSLRLFPLPPPAPQHAQCTSASVCVRACASFRSRR